MAGTCAVGADIGGDSARSLALCYGRAWLGHPRLAVLIAAKAGMVGTSMPLGGPPARPERPAMTWGQPGPAMLQQAAGRLGRPFERGLVSQVVMARTSRAMTGTRGRCVSTKLRFAVARMGTRPAITEEQRIWPPRRLAMKTDPRAVYIPAASATLTTVSLMPSKPGNR